MLRGNIVAFRELTSLFTRHGQLMWELAKHEIVGRYAGQWLGSFWALGHPLFLMAVYVFVFAFVFKIKLGGTFEFPRDYPIYLLSGLIPWMAFQDVMNKSAFVIVAHANLVKQVVFPIEVLPVKTVLASTFSQVVALFTLVVYVLTTHQSLPWTYVLLPAVALVQLMWMIGVAYILSAVGAYFRDLKDFVQVFGMIGLFLMPIVYLPAQVPELFKPVLYLNPFSSLAWVYQDVLYFGRMEHPLAWGFFVSFSLGSFVVGYRLFRKLKMMFGNVL